MHDFKIQLPKEIFTDVFGEDLDSLQHGRTITIEGKRLRLGITTLEVDGGYRNTTLCGRYTLDPHGASVSIEGFIEKVKSEKDILIDQLKDLKSQISKLEKKLEKMGE